MSSKTFTVTTVMQGALPRSKRLKAALSGGTITGGTGVAGSTVGSGGDGHSHSNKTLLDSLAGDDEGYLYIVGKQADSDDSVAAKVLAGGADEWAGHAFDDWMDQPVRTDDEVQFASVTVDKVVFTNGASLEVDGDMLKFSAGIWSMGEVTAYGKGSSGSRPGGGSGSGGGGGYPLLTSWSGYDDSMAGSYALSAGLGRSLYGSSHSHPNRSVLDSITSAKVATWDAAASGISKYLLTSWNGYNPSEMINSYAISAGLGWGLRGRITILEGLAHSHGNNSVLDGITAAKVAAWDAAAGGSGGGSSSGGNASQAEKLAHARKLWGNSFDGSKDINGLLDASTNGIKTNKITFTNGVTLETDGDMLKFSSGIYSMGEVAAYGKGASGGSGGGSGSGYAKRLEFVYNNDDPATVRLKITGYDATETGVKIYLMRNLKRKLCFRYDPSISSRANYHTTSGWRHPLDGMRHSYSEQVMVTEWNVTAETWEMSAATIFNQFKGKGVKMNHQRLDFDHRIKGFGFALYKGGVRISNICRVDVTVAVTSNVGSVKVYPAL